MALRKERIDRSVKVRSGSIFVLSSWREMLYLAGPKVFPVILLFTAAFISDTYWQRVMLNIVTFSLLALSWDMLAETGMVSLGHALFFGVGAYISGILNYYWGVSTLISIPAGAVLGGLVCTAILLPLVRLRGIYFSMVTLVIPMLMIRLIEATGVFGGTEGLVGLDPMPYEWMEMYLPLGILVIALYAFRRLMSSDTGLIFKGIQNSHMSVINAGINIYWYRAQSLFYAGTLAALAGALVSHVYLFVGMPVFALDYSILTIAAAVVGGIGSFIGPVIGAFILVPLSEILRDFGSLRIVFYGALLVIFIVGMPNGIFPLIVRKYHQFERWVEVK